MKLKVVTSTSTLEITTRINNGVSENLGLKLLDEKAKLRDEKAKLLDIRVWIMYEKVLKCVSGSCNDNLHNFLASALKTDFESFHGDFSEVVVRYKDEIQPNISDYATLQHFPTSRFQYMEVLTHIGKRY